MSYNLKTLLPVFVFSIISACSLSPKTNDVATIQPKKEIRAVATTVDSKTAACAIPIFSWTNADVNSKNVAAFTIRHIVGGIEASQTVWDPKAGGMDLAGRGMYFSGDPFSSQSYGDHLVIAQLKPNQDQKDLRQFGLLENSGTATSPEVENAVRSESPLILHSWVAKTGNAAAIVARAKVGAKPESLPVELQNLEVVVTPAPEVRKSWSSHKPVLPNDTLAQALTKYADKILSLHDSWESFDAQPSADLVWKIIFTDLQTDLADEQGQIIEKYQVDPFESLQYNSEDMPAEAIALLTKAAQKKKYLPASAKVATTADLKEQMTKAWVQSTNYKNYLSIYSYLQNFKRKYGIQQKQDELNPSTLEATSCPH